MRSRKTVRHISAVVGTLFVTSACLALAAQPATATTERGAIGEQRRVAVLKAAILGISERAQGTCDEDDNNRVVAAILNRLTDRLVAVTGSRTEPEKLPQVTGGWKQVWSDLDSGSPICTSADDIYQVVFPDGYYWNIAELAAPGAPASQGFLRGAYEVTPDFLEIEFTRQAVSPVVSPPGTDLVDLAGRAEAGAFVPLPAGPPVGVRGELQNTYVDDDLRIVRGLDDRPGATASIFVLVRADVTG